MSAIDTLRRVPLFNELSSEELGRIASGHAFDIHNTPARLRRMKTHPWAGLTALRQTLPG